MKQSEALAIVDQLTVAAQKSRSILSEIGVSEELVELLAPASGNMTASVLPILLKITDRGTMTTLDYNNIVTLITSTAPEIEAAYMGMGGQALSQDWSLVTDGWEPEGRAD